MSFGSYKYTHQLHPTVMTRYNYFYNEVQKLHHGGKAHDKIIMGDFNAKVIQGLCRLQRLSTYIYYAVHLLAI